MLALSILWMGTLRHRREGPFLTSQNSGRSWVLNPGDLATEPEFLATHDSCLGNNCGLCGGTWPRAQLSVTHRRRRWDQCPGRGWD